MRAELLYNPWLLCERLAELSAARRRRRSLRGTPAAWLTDDHIGSLELLRMLSAEQTAVVYDIGANVGTWTLLLKSIHPNAIVHAVEPLPRFAGEFQRHTSGLSGVTLHRVALGDRAASLPMHVTSFADASSLLPLASAGASQWHIREVEQEAVNVEPMDQWQARTGAPMPTLIKLDVQGYEGAVLRGAERCLANASAVLAEVSFRDFYEGQSSFADVTALLAAQGFRLHAVGRDTALGRPLVQTDALFLADGHRGR